MAQSKNYKGKNRGGNNRSGNNQGGNSRGGNYQGGNNRGGNNNRGDNRNRDNRDRDNRPPKQQEGQAPSNKPATASKSKPDTSNDLLWFMLVLFLVAGGFLFNKFYLAPRRPGIYNSNYVSPPFKKEGQLSFLDAQSGKNIIRIDIEVADRPAELNFGLKNRRFLPANGGMLFYYKEEMPRTFTMESVYLSLDILFIDGNREIIRIRKNAQPLTKESIPSGGKAQFVLQVQAGICDAFNIRVGDRVKF